MSLIPAVLVAVVFSQPFDISCKSLPKLRKYLHISKDKKKIFKMEGKFCHVPSIIKI